MVKRVGSSRYKTRHLFHVSKKMKGKLTISGFVRKMEIGDNVLLSAQPSIMEGIYFRRFHGRIGKVVGTQGACYKVQIRDGGKEKTLIVGPVHLKKAYITISAKVRKQ